MAFAFNPGANVPMEPTTKVELSIRAEKLADMDLLNKSDPFCVIFLKEMNGESRWLEVGRTEVIKNQESPVWIKKIELDYRFEERQFLKFEVYDQDTKGRSLSDQDFLGSCESTLAEVVTGGSNGSVFSKPLLGQKKTSMLFVSVEELSGNKEDISWVLSAKDLDKKDLFGKGDPFIVISRSNLDGGGFSPVYQTEVIKNEKNPQWKPFNTSGASLCSGDHQRPLKFEAFDWDNDGSRDFIGSAVLTLEEILEKSPFKVDLINEKKKEKKGSKYKNSGVLHFQRVVSKSTFTFLDYIQSGLQINFTVAVDFTASNGDPNNAGSLHYRNDPNNQYILAIKSVGEIIQDYDTDKIFPALGFGARIPPTFQVSHEFFLNLRTDSPHCEGIQGVLQAYQTSLNSVKLYGPTNFSPVINHVARFADAYTSNPSHYFILLIITDGIITDMANTKKAIISASSLPMSIIIVGVGNEDFSAMEELDGDDGNLACGNVKPQRDIVQFVELQKFLSGSNSKWSKEYLAKEVLAEVPKQISEYMRIKGVKPGFS